MDIKAKLGITALCALAVFGGCGKSKSSDTDRTADTPSIPPGDTGDQGTMRPVAVESEAERPNCGPSTKGMLVYIRDKAEFQICLADAWEAVQKPSNGSAGPRGEQGPAGSSFGFNVKDSSGRVIGVTDFHEYGNYLYNSEIFFRLADGVVMNVNVTSGRNSGQYCYYTSNDCSGTCLYPVKVGEKNKVIEGLASLFRVTGTETLSSQPYQSYAVSDNPSPSCAVLMSPVTASLAAIGAAYSPTAPVTYPFPAPMTVEPQ